MLNCAEQVRIQKYMDEAYGHHQSGLSVFSEASSASERNGFEYVLCFVLNSDVVSKQVLLLLESDMYVLSQFFNMFCVLFLSGRCS